MEKGHYFIVTNENGNTSFERGYSHREVYELKLKSGNVVISGFSHSEDQFKGLSKILGKKKLTLVRKGERI